MSCCSSVTRSALSSERNRYSVCVPLRRLRSFVWTMPRQLPGVTWTTFITRQRSFWCCTIMPTRSCVAGMSIECDLVHPVRRVERGVNGRAVMMDEEPASIAPLEHVRRLHLRLDLAVAVAALDSFRHDDPRDVAARLHACFPEREAHLERALEDTPPAVHHRSPSGYELPARVHARHVCRA